jgi:hypothetical protein
VRRWPLWPSLTTTALATAFAAGMARADGPTGVELGMRTGDELPFGSSTGLANDALGNTTTSFIPIWVDVGYRFEEHFAVGGYFRHGSGHSYQWGTGWSDCQFAASPCNATDTLIGVQVHYHFFPDRLIDPWAGFGAGYEFLDYNTEGGGSHDFSLEGYDFFNLQAGVDFKPIPSLGLGPFVALTVGQFSPGATTTFSPNVTKTALHEWLALGIRITYDIKMPSFALPPDTAPASPSSAPASSRPVWKPPPQEFH